MPDTLRRIAVTVPDSGAPGTVDLVVPADRPLGELMPSIVEAAASAADGPRRWLLTRVAGEPVDTSLSLRDNDVDDGAMLVLADVRIPPPRRRPADPCAVVADGITAPGSDVLGPAAAVAAASTGAAALAWAGVTAPTPWHLWTAAALSLVAGAGAVAAARGDRTLAALLSTAATQFAVTAGLLATPAAPWAAMLLLAASAGFAVTVLLLRWLPDLPPLTTLAAASAAVTAAAGVGNLAPGVPTFGAALAAVSLAGLSVAGKLAALCTADDGSRSAAAHRALTELVAGWSASAAAGGVVVSVAAIGTGAQTVPAAVFAADLGVLLVLRGRVHADTRRRLVLGVAGVTSLLAALLVTVAAAPDHAGWLGAGATAFGALAVSAAARPWPSNPLLSRLIQYAEYAALVAVVPLACWLAGVYGMVGQLSLA
ncbi:type VII secretion integral membrane protein EccD [Mycobacterium sp. ITM-2016-00317]|uniref:type VII secretion integral membrane protein EccD n=1 Tax=Mycobacterium sp. ITM-2016-00317 TaxID=2099694 RepID=UPI00287F8962|nr:type VII secretion integral membrane protein EccD [Mycobacterium sp. ITM-2016-00317]WNG88755.1 type VII secretion integral membrane protein EccD [Mycobacterium sp. ITM-2016-00317]